MHVLVVGGAGYIGSHTAGAFLDAGHSVTVIDNLATGLRENIFPESRFIHADILNQRALEAAFARAAEEEPAHALVHLAAFKAAGESMVEPEKYAENNISGTISLLNAAVAAGVEDVVFSSSAAVYGEPTYLPVDENHPTKPTNFYGYTKLAIEELLRWYADLKGVRYAALRYFNAAGYDPRGRVHGLELNPANLLPVIMEVAVGIRESLTIFGNDYDTRDGTGIRDYVHVTDLARAHVLALHHIRENRTNLTVNLGSEEGISVMEMLETARRETGREIPAEVGARRAGDPAALVASAGQARAILGWNPEFSDVTSLVRTTWAAYERALL
ncbi:MAG: UDP-glucose 4-epimerase GalE [Spirochaetaceae bacterium]